MSEVREILDALIVGGGPAGTAAAFRARELGLEALVIDYDDLMKRIRDYSKDKLILPSFGGGDRMRFPRGGELVDELRFPAIDKDEMCSRWKGLYAERGVPARVGVELTGLERRPDGTFRATTWDHGERCEGEYAARFVVLALGRGVPRRFDIPGDTDGIAHRLADPEPLVGAPACVIGGGTSAAEAVITLSNAKAAAGDASAVYWSYRGDRMPRCSKALAEVFFEAYVGNGNIRYYPLSEPAAVVIGADRREYLAIRVDRRAMAGRPSETLHFEFPKESCIACIGEDIPAALLRGMGIEMAEGGPAKRRRMVVNRCLESVQPGIFLAGDLLSQAYFETEDFDADPAGFREVKHRGNIKAALRDGVLIAQVIRQRLDGREEIDTAVEEHQGPEPEGLEAVAAAHSPVAIAVAPEEDVEAPAEDDLQATLVRLLPTGIEGDQYTVPRDGVTTLGRADCDIRFPDDSLLGRRHASISHHEGRFFLRDDGGPGGLFVRLRAARKRRIGDGDLLRAGKQFLVFRLGDGASFAHYDSQGAEVGRHRLEPGVTIVGREAPGVTLDAGDGTLSRRHLAISVEDGALAVKDLKSVNGTFLRVRGALELEHGDEIRLGRQTLVFGLRDDASLDAGHAAPSAPAEAAPPPVAAPPEEAATSGVSVSFQGVAGRFPVASGQTVCEAAEAQGVEITAECHSGICGSDPVRILAGLEHAGEPSDQERETLEELCELEPGECRLACMLKIKGPVDVEIL